jgi:hypothetical protein
VHRSVLFRAPLLALLLIATAACGGGDDAPEATNGTEPGGSEATSEPGAATPGAENGDESDDSGDAPAAGGASVAVITIGEYRYEIDVTPGAIQRCDPDFFGGFWALGSGDGGTLELELWPDGMEGETDRVAVSDNENDFDWVADAEADFMGVVETGVSQVDSFTVDGSTASGTATFIEENAVFAAVGGTGEPPEPVTGTFEVVCGE